MRGCRCTFFPETNGDKRTTGQDAKIRWAGLGSISGGETMTLQLGQSVNIIETRQYSVPKRTVRRVGRVVQVCDRFAAVDNGRFVNAYGLTKTKE